MFNACVHKIDGSRKHVVHGEINRFAFFDLRTGFKIDIECAETRFFGKGACKFLYERLVFAFYFADGV